MSSSYDASGLRQHSKRTRNYVNSRNCRKIGINKWRPKYVHSLGFVEIKMTKDCICSLSSKKSGLDTKWDCVKMYKKWSLSGNYNKFEVNNFVKKL